MACGGRWSFPSDADFSVRNLKCVPVSKAACVRMARRTSAASRGTELTRYSKDAPTPCLASGPSSRVQVPGPGSAAAALPLLGIRRGAAGGSGRTAPDCPDQTGLSGPGMIGVGFGRGCRRACGSHPVLENQRPELPNPFSAREESCRVSASSTKPVRTGIGIICAIFSPGWRAMEASPRLVMRTRISPR